MTARAIGILALIFAACSTWAGHAVYIWINDWARMGMGW